MSTSDNSDDDEATLSWGPGRVVFTQTPDWILNNPKINDGAFRTWVAISSFASNREHTAFPSARKLMEMRGKGRRIIFEHIAQLEAAGVLRREARYRPNGGRTSSHYTLAWDRPLSPVQKSAPAPSARERTTPRAADCTGPGAENRAPRTTTTKELDPLPPQSDEHTTAATDAPQGAPAPRTPRSKKQGSRNDGTNPRAVQAQASKSDQMRRWALNMHGALDHDEFVEIVEAEVRAEKITHQQGATAIEESLRLFNQVDRTSATT